MRRSARVAPALVLAVVACGLTGGVLGVAAPASAGSGTPPGGFGTAGPPYRFTTELMGGDVEPLPNEAALSRTRLGYRFRAGQQDDDVTITLTSDGRLQLVDPGATAGFEHLARTCDEVQVDTGVAATCPVPAGISEEKPLLVEVWTRLGDDSVDSRSLPAEFAVSFLADQGDDTAWFGAGPDFLNGHLGTDRASGGDGNDWIRPGGDDDLVSGGAADDQVVDSGGNDQVSGDAGDDRLYSGTGDDRVVGGSGADLMICGAGSDEAEIDDLDRGYATCEVTTTAPVDRGARGY